MYLYFGVGNLWWFCLLCNEWECVVPLLRFAFTMCCIVLEIWTPYLLSCPVAQFVKHSCLGNRELCVWISYPGHLFFPWKKVVLGTVEFFAFVFLIIQRAVCLFSVCIPNQQNEKQVNNQTCMYTFSGGILWEDKTSCSRYLLSFSVYFHFVYYHTIFRVKNNFLQIIFLFAESETLCIHACVPVVFPDFGGPTMANLIGTAGPGDGPFVYFSGLAMKQSLASCEAG